eukprot:TRINITY_DN4674_c0_g1_i1.p1 TRINITY_DN4674_c0_g1~~TRINITY_DN4674_c0_g1_i1.p1  ORF type:complete len:333 (+),score=76.53 TRINITY_DN4674_c0_g1_i1:111-1109(+)
MEAAQSASFVKTDEGLVGDESNIKFEDLELEESIGEGSFGKVLKGRYFGTYVAVKKLFNHEDRKMQKYIQRELATLKNIRHPQIVQFIGFSIHSSGLYVVTEYVPGGDLTVYIDNFNMDFKWKDIMKVLIQVGQAMAYLHAKNILHRDLKCSNLLVSDSTNWGIKVCDFGMARKTQDKKFAAMTICGTDEYMAPEVLMGNSYNDKADVFSFALIMYELLTRRVPPARELKTKFTFNQVAFEKLCASNASPLLVELVRDCAQADPSKRPDFKTILEALNNANKTIPGDDIVQYKGIIKTPVTNEPPKARSPSSNASLIMPIPAKKYGAGTTAS